MLRYFFLVVVLLATSFSQNVYARTLTVSKNDSLYLLARRCGAGVVALKKQNHLSSNIVRLGQKIVCPGAGNTKKLGSQNTGMYSARMGTKKIQGVPVAIMRINLAHPRVSLRLLVPRRGLGNGGERLTRMSARAGAFAAINGGYFNTRSYAPVGDVVYRGRRLVSSGRIGTALALDYRGRASIVSRRSSWRNYKLLVANGPHVLQNNKIIIAPRQEGYRDASVWQPNARSFVGVVGLHELVFVSAKTKITLRQAARIAQALGAHDALMLDGGSSVGFVWRGQTLINPVRAVSYGLGVFIH